MKTYDSDINLYFELKGSPEATKESYTTRINAFMRFIHCQQKNVEEITLSDIQQYILYLKKEKGLSAGTINNYISGIKFFYTYVLGKEWNRYKVPRMKRILKMPIVPPKDDILRLLDSVQNLKHKAILLLLYGSGLRVGEVAHLRISDICSKTMRVRVANAKHNTNRYTILSQKALEVLREYFREHFAPKSYKPDDWLFTGKDKNQPIHIKTIKNTMIKLRDRLNLDKGISSHSLRYAFASHALEDGVNTAYIQQMLGHKRFQTTAGYLYVTSKSIMGVKSPLDTPPGGRK